MLRSGYGGSWKETIYCTAVRYLAQPRRLNLAFRQTSVVDLNYEGRNEPICSCTQIYDRRKSDRELQGSLQDFRVFIAGFYVMGMGPSKLGRDA